MNDDTWQALAVGFAPFLHWLLGFCAVALVLTCPLPSRGPGIFGRRDPWRGFKFELRRTVLYRGGRTLCRFSLPRVRALSRDATDVDHVYQWSMRGAMIVANGQALCRDHYKRKSNMTPSWWYLVVLERRRRS